jgi:hypothetical protein
MKIQTQENEFNYSPVLSTKNSVFLQGRTKKPVIHLPKEWEEFVDLTSITVHLTQIGANQNLIVKRVQGLEVHLQTNGLPVDCYYFISGQVLDTASVV